MKAPFRITYSKCTVFPSGTKLNAVWGDYTDKKYCLGAFDMGDDSETILEECRQCTKWLGNEKGLS